MTPQQLIPPLDPYGLPAPPWVFVLLLNLTLVLHFIAMGYVFGATFLHIFLAALARKDSPAEWMLHRTEKLLSVALSFTITLGVAPLLFVQVLYQPVFYNANILIGYQWFGIVFVLMGGFYLIYLCVGGRIFGRRLPRILHVLARLAIFGTVAYVLVTMTANAILAMNPDSWKAVRESGGNFLLGRPPILVPRLLHNILAALIIGGVWMIALGARSERTETASPTAQEGAQHLRKTGAMTVMVGALFQTMVGGWLFFVEKPEVRETLVSGRPASVLWLLSLAGVLALLMLGLWSLVQRPGKAVLAIWGVLALILAGMFSAREAARQVRLAPYMSLDQWAVKPQATSLALFLVSFAAAIAIIGMMAVWLVKGWRGEEAK